jgi:large conductance mechanosensitive channel
MLDGFKKFILRGNVVDMAVGIVIGAAFGGVVTSLVKSFIEPLIALTVGKPDFNAVGTTISGAHGPVQVPWGAFLTAVINFLLIAAAIYFFVVVPVNALIARMHRGEKPADPTTKQCPECMSEIPIQAKRCSHCTQPVMGRAA